MLAHTFTAHIGASPARGATFVAQNGGYFRWQQAPCFQHTPQFGYKVNEFFSNKQEKEEKSDYVARRTLL